MNQLIIVGAGGFGREVSHWVTQNPSHGLEYSIKGFLDDNPKALGNYRNYPPIIGSIKKYKPDAADIFVCGLGIPAQKMAAITLLLNKGAKFMNLIHPSVVFGGNIKLGSGVVIAPHVTISADIALADFVTVDSNSVLGHDSKIGAWSHVGNLCSLTGGVTLEDGVFIGAHSVILPNITIGENALVGAGSVVTKNVLETLVVFGNPAKSKA